MEKSLTLSVLWVALVLLGTVNGFPIDISSVGEGASSPFWLTNYFLTGCGFFLIIVTIIFGCVCCRNGKGFKEFRNSNANLDVPRPEGFVNPTLNSELTIFPPLGANANEICRFEPLPDIKYQAQNLRPAAFSYTEQEISSQDWFFDPYSNFPRNQLKYVQEYGRGWFGRVVEGEAQNITPEEKVTKVMVKILHEDATATDHMYFLHEVKFYRDLKHPNILQLLGRCLETEPFLVILECYPNGDLKTFLSQNLPSAQALVEQGVTLQMCSNITSGLQYMHDNKFIHTDLAARNCLVGPDLSVRIGDYGNSIEIFKSDYYCAGSVALPVRWCAPETLKCTDITIETREVTPPANIWSLGVVFWEICEFCKLPYAELNDDQVIVRVLGEKNYFLEKPNMNCLHKDEMYHLMKLCWKSPVQRPTASQISIVLNNLISSNSTSQGGVHSDPKRFSQDFEQRWINSKPNSIPKKDNAFRAVDLSPSIECSSISSKLKNAKVADSSYLESPLGIFMSSKSSGQESPRLCLKFDKKADHKVEKEQDLPKSEGENQTLKVKANIEVNSGDAVSAVDKSEFDHSIDSKINPLEKMIESEQDVDSWLKGVEINNEEDESFVRKISEAIRDLDATLALEKTSSSEENSGKSSRQNSPGKDIKEGNEPVVDFKLGNDTSSFLNFTQKSFEITSLQNSEQPQSLNFTDTFTDKKDEDYGPDSLIMPFIGKDMNKCKGEVLDESLKENDSSLCGQSRNSSDTDDEVWRRRIERGEISEKVKEKSKSIVNLMVLTHIDSDDSDIDYDKPFEKGLNRNSFLRRSGSFAKSSLPSNNFGSENDLPFTVLEDEFKESLKKLRNDHKEHGHFDSLDVILPSSVNRENVWESLFKPSDLSSESAGDTNLSQTDVNKTLKDSDDNTKNGNHFLGDGASKKHKNTEGIGQIQKTTVPNETEGGELKDEPKCDNRTSNPGSNNSSIYSNPGESSHSKESDADVKPGNEDSLKKEVLDESSSEKNDNKMEIPGIFLGDECFSLSGSEKVSDLKAETDIIDLPSKKKPVSPGSPDNIHSEEKPNDSKMPNLKEALKKTDENSKKLDRIFESVLPERKPFNFVPQITITEEPEEELIESEEEKFEFVRPQPKPLKFVMKDYDAAPETNLEQSNNSFSCDKFLPKNSDFGKSLEESTTVIVGACKDFTMDYFKGLKTTSEDVNIKNHVKDYQNDEENLDVWDKHLEKAFSQQLSNTNFDDVSFRSFELDSSDEHGLKQVSLVKDNFSPCSFPMTSILDFIESEKLHTEKQEDSIHINRLTSLPVMANEEEYEHFKLRTPDDERSSDSGFRDKGSLSESVEDACEGKYNLEDIEAELEEAFVKGVFGNSDSDKEKDSTSDLKNCNNFEYEESKFYEDESKNEEDFSDIDGEIEFWHNKDESDYYPEISEFRPAFSQGWYLHPPDESAMNFDRNVNEEIVNALRNELQESLPVQNRSFDEFNDFYETEIEGAKRDLNIHYGSELVLPLSPILEEQDSSTFTVQKNLKNSLLDGNTSKVRKHIVKLMESVKAVDTNTFKQYLDYMIENEGRILDEIEEVDEDVEDNKESVTEFLETEEKNHSEAPLSCLGLQHSEPIKTEKVNTADDNLSMKINTKEETLLERSENEDCLEAEILTENSENNSENDGLMLTPQLLSPDKERSLSEMSRSSNGTRTGDALSEITLSSPDLVPDCFSTSAQEMPSANDNGEIVKEPYLNETKNKFSLLENSVVLNESVNGSPELNLMKFHTENNFLNHSGDIKTEKSESPGPNQNPLDGGNPLQSNDMYEMSTSFMGGDDDDDDDETFLNLNKSEQNPETDEHTAEQKTNKNDNDDSDTTDWQSESSEDEESSSSSGEFIWKDGNKQSKIKAASANDFITEPSLYEETQNEEKTAEAKTNGTSSKENFNEDNNLMGDEDDDNESSTGSSASITDFVPSAWNSQATPSRSALRSPNKKADTQKKNVWFKKQKYHCVYEYPREPSDSEDSEGSPFKQANFETNPEPPNKHFNYGVNTIELPNQHFPYGISKVIDFSTFVDWDVVEGDDADLSSTDTDSENGTGKTDLSFYNLSPFDYDFNTSDLHEGESEFFVSSSSRPFQVVSSSQFLPGNNQPFFNNMVNKNGNLKDFVTPDSGIEDSTNVTPSENVNLTEEKGLPKVKNSTHSKAGIINILDNLNYNFELDVKDNDGRSIDMESFAGENTKSKNGFSCSESSSIPLSNVGLGDLRHARDKLKLDLPRNHNTELGAIINKKNQ